jgi:hypothetical protein
VDRIWLSKRLLNVFHAREGRRVETGGKHKLVNEWGVCEVVSASIHGYYSFAGLVWIVMCEDD